MAYLEALLGDAFNSLRPDQKNMFYVQFSNYLISNTEILETVQKVLADPDDSEAKRDLDILAKARAQAIRDSFD